MTVDESRKESQSVGPANTSGKAPRTRAIGWGFFILLIAGLAIMGWFIRKGISARASSETSLVSESKNASILTVAVTHPLVAGATHELAVPGNTQPLSDAPIFARTSGYLKKWYFDIGSHVRQGDLLAEIETPEVDQQLQQARADLDTARANLDLSSVTAGRYESLQKKGAVAKQDADDKVGDMRAKKSILDSATANVKRLENLQAFEKIYAPFDGVITARNTDVGQLVTAGSGPGGKELFHLAATSRLRLFVSVPEEYERAAVNGTAAILTLPEFPGRTFQGVIVRNANSIDQTSRTLLVEVDVDNPKGELLPGAYVSVHLKLSSGTAQALTVPVDALMFRAEGTRAAVIKDGKAQLVRVEIGRDFGDTLEIVSGLKAADTIIVNPPDSLASGTPVKVVASPVNAAARQ